MKAQPVLVSSVAEEWQARRMKIQPVLATSVAQVWPSVEKHIASALEYSKGDYNADHAKVYLSRGDWNLFVAVNKSNTIKGAAIVEYINRPNDRVAFMIAIGGRLITSADTFSQFKDLLKFDGATKLEGAARESVARLWMSRFGCTEKYRIVEVSL